MWQYAVKRSIQVYYKSLIQSFKFVCFNSTVPVTSFWFTEFYLLKMFCTVFHHLCPRHRIVHGWLIWLPVICLLIQWYPFCYIYWKWKYICMQEICLFLILIHKCIAWLILFFLSLTCTQHNYCVLYIYISFTLHFNTGFHIIYQIHLHVMFPKEKVIKEDSISSFVPSTCWTTF
jgi:hypothetical protein